MLIGEDFDKIQFEFLGLQLQEPIGFAGDVVIFIVSMIIAYKIKQIGTEKPFFKCWYWFFMVFGWGFLAGGFGHLLYYYLGVPGKYGSWYSGVATTFFMERAMISLHHNKKFIKITHLLSTLKLILGLIGLTWIVSTVDLDNNFSKAMLFPTINSTIGVLFSLVYLGTLYSKRIDKSFNYFWISFLVMVPSVFISSLKINLHQWFDKNDLSHVALLIGVIFYYLGIRGYARYLSINR